MSQPSAWVGQFMDRLQFLLSKEISIYHSLKVAKHSNVYIVGDKASKIYFIEKGQIKLVMTSPEGKGCLLSIHTPGDIFGELCLTGLNEHLETATAMQDSCLKQISSARFFAFLTENLLVEGFVKYLATRIANQQQVITNLVTIDSEQRLGKTLLQLARSIGKKNPHNTTVEIKISHEEFSEMIGTTRPRISLFMQRFRQLGLIELTKEHFLIINEKKLSDYLTQIINNKILL